MAINLPSLPCSADGRRSCQARLNSLDNEIQPDPMLDERAERHRRNVRGRDCRGAGRAVLWLNNTSVNQAGTEPSARTAQTQPGWPAAPSGMRGVTPKANSAWHDHRRARPSGGCLRWHAAAPATQCENT
jgi:hypothetical protein